MIYTYHSEAEQKVLAERMEQESSAKRQEESEALEQKTKEAYWLALHNELIRYYEGRTTQEAAYEVLDVQLDRLKRELSKRDDYMHADELYSTIKKEADSIRQKIQEHSQVSQSAQVDNLNTTPFTIAGESLKQKFSSEYMTAQIDIMLKMQNENPTEAIGKSKEFIESCCKTILEEGGQTIDKDGNMNSLVKETMRFLQISTDSLKDNTAEIKTVKAILGSLGAIAGSIAELRNAYGSGHGKSANYKGLSSRHAKLAVGSSITLVNYLWETYEWRKSKVL